MKLTIFVTTALSLGMALSQTALAQSPGHPKLHLTNRWTECSFQLDSSLTQSAWHQFTQEAGLVAYFRPLESAQPLGRGNFELSVLRYDTAINDSLSAWNDTFVHPDSTHWLKEGPGLKVPGLFAEVGVSGSTNVGVYFTKNPNANYGFFAGQVQQTVLQSAEWASAVRLNYVRIFGPEDFDFSTYGVDVLGSRTIALSRWLSVSPYAGVSTYLASSHEKSPRVTLNDEHVVGTQAMGGVAVQLSKARIAAEYNLARVNSLSLKVGIAR